MPLTQEFSQAAQLINKAQRIIFTTHEKTDGDDLGSVLSIAQHCQKQGKDIEIIITGSVPSALSDLKLSELVKESSSNTNFDLLIISGCSNIERTNNQTIQNLKIPTINFDHHPDNKLYATINVVDATKSSVAELIYDFFKFNDWEINKDIAQCLLTGIITDTGVLQHSNTQASTLAAASELMQHGASIHHVVQKSFTRQSIQSLRAWAVALENSYFNPENKMIYSIITQEQLASLGNPELNVFEGVVETLNKVPEAKFAMFLKEDDGRIKGSLRSDPFKGIDVKNIAQKLGGGGHKWAAGFSMFGKLAKQSNGKWEITKQI
ncbi:MAG: bifunctional oligoribonuclease/PAP phosphatase NrnA [Candidatus Doudnabacteria bacterium]